MSENNGQRFDFLDSLAKKNFSPYETRVLFALLKWQLIYNNGGVIMSLGRIAKVTDLPECHVCRAIRGLLQKGLQKTIKNGLPFYSLGLPIKALPTEAGGTADTGRGGLPVEAIKLPVEAGVIKDSNEVTNNNRGSKENQNKDNDFKAETRERFEAFQESYPGAWHKGIWNRVFGVFLNATPSEQVEFIKALKSYKTSKPVKEKKILSPINFLQSPKILKQHAQEARPVKRGGEFTAEDAKRMRERAEADPPRGSLKEDFEKLVTATAGEKAVNQKGRARQ